MGVSMAGIGVACAAGAAVPLDIGATGVPAEAGACATVGGEGAGVSGRACGGVWALGGLEEDEAKLVLGWSSHQK
ncbi:MAG: hypothetical protein ACKVQU_22400 [Burkholderiales bacterium]